MEINFGSVIKQIREERGFTLKEAAGTAISPNNLSKFEKGITTIKVDTYFKILENLKIHDTHDVIMLLVRYQYQDPSLSEAIKTGFTTQTKILELIQILESNTYCTDCAYIQSLGMFRNKENLLKEDWIILNRAKTALFQLNYWLPLDYTLFALLVEYFDFPTETLQQIAKTALALLKETFIDFIQKRGLLLTLLTIIRTYSRNGHYQLAQNLVDKIDVYRMKELHSLKGVLQEAFIQIKMQECYNLLRQDKKEGIELASQILAYLDSLNGLFLDQTISQLRDIFYQQVKMLNKTGIDWP